MSVEPTSSKNNDIYWDPYNREIYEDPYPVFSRMREEAPLYYNEEHDFYALSRFDDVQDALGRHETLISGYGGLLEFIKAGIPMPRGMFIFEDEPRHTIHRDIVARVFTPKKMEALESQIRSLTSSCLDQFVGEKGFDFVKHLGDIVPMRVIGMLLGIPEADTDEVRKTVNSRLRTEEGQALDSNLAFMSEGFEGYIDWRMKNPSEDLMTQLINAEIIDEEGTKRTLTRDEISVFVTVLVGAGNDTTNRGIGWIGKVLADHPDQRRQLVEDPSLIPNAVDEILRYEGPAPAVARLVTRDIEYYGQTVPENSALVLTLSSANRDSRRFINGDTFDIRRERRPNLAFGGGIHTCLGVALTRLEMRIALEETLKRFPEWEVDLDNAKIAFSTTTRGYESLPVHFA